jgi:hypothetical protein
MIHTHNSLTPYDRRFYRTFIDELAQRNSPHFPDKLWWRALNTADAIAPCTEPLPVLSGCQLINRESAWRVGRAELADSLNTREISLASSRWLDRYARF